MPSMKKWERRFSMPMTSRYRDIERSRSKKISQKCYEFSYKGYSLQEFIVPLSSCAYWLDVRGAYGGGYGLQEGGRPITITCCLHGLERGQRLIVGVGGTGNSSSKLSIHSENDANPICLRLKGSKVGVAAAAWSLYRMTTVNPLRFLLLLEVVAEVSQLFRPIFPGRI